MIEPTIGRKCYVKASEYDIDNLGLTILDNLRTIDATIVFINGDGTINAAGFDHAGNPYALENLAMVQGNDFPDTEGESFAYWMPYQNAQADQHRGAPL